MTHLTPRKKPLNTASYTPPKNIPSYTILVPNCVNDYFMRDERLLGANKHRREKLNVNKHSLNPK